MHYKDLIVRLGKLPIASKPSETFHEESINFLDFLSKNIMKNNMAKNFPDLFTFGFWCRRENLIKIKKNYNYNSMMFGRGIAFHVCPSNVPMNFAYSLAFGILAGNNNIIRLPSKNFQQTEILISIIKKILHSQFKNIRNKICLIQYIKSDEISKFLSKISNVRLIWGGDETINNFKQYATKPRCVDLCFPNRYSISIISIKELSKINLDNLNTLSNKFYNDCYTMDQLGCSSPQAVIFIGKNNYKVDKFWRNIKKIVEKKYNLDFSVANTKFVSISSNIINSDLKVKADLRDFNLVKLRLKRYDKKIDDFQCGFGTFFEIKLNKLNQLKYLVSDKLQTITYYGFTNQQIKKFISFNNLLGIDRFVPIGRAFDMSHIWDGFDIIESISRKIDQ